MKKLMTITLTLALLLICFTGCGPAMAGTLDAAEDMVENRVDQVEDAVESAVQTGSLQAPAMTREEAEAIALEHAGFTADQVTYLRTEYEIDDGIPQYEVQFHQGRWEYDYEIDANTGAIMSYDMDD